jgi:hypothetical protein
MDFNAAQPLPFALHSRSSTDNNLVGQGYVQIVTSQPTTMADLEIFTLPFVGV